MSVQRYVNKIVNIQPESCEISAKRKKVAVFLPCKAKWWGTMEPIWEEYCMDEGFEVHVLPIFYYDCDYNGNIGEKHDERALFPDYVKVEDCEKFDFENVHPDIIVTQTPYDGWSTTMTVHEFFYSSNLLNYTEELIYVPCFEMNPPSEKGDKASTAISYFIEQEGVINADRIVINNTDLRDLYLEHLTELCGVDTASYWEQKIVVMEKKTADSDANESTDVKLPTLKPQGRPAEECPQEWQMLIGENSSKKVLVYCYSISFLLQGKNQAIDKLRRSLEIFNENTDRLTVVFLPQRQILEDLKEIDKELWEKYQVFTKEISSGKASIYDEKGLSSAYIDKWSGYYGDPSVLARKCVLHGIPVMIQNIEI